MNTKKRYTMGHIADHLQEPPSREWQMKGEQLLRPKVVAQKLGVSIATLYRIRGQLIARGVKVVTIRGDPKYIESSIDRLIAKCAAEERPLV